jgi:peptidoglycan/LPS O-acetylase OafA/YrhL
MIPGVAGSALRFYPFNPPHWSLWYELVASYCFGLVAPLLSRTVLLGAVAIAAIALAVVTLDRGTGEHFDATRVVFAFLIGVAIQRIGFRARFGAPVAIGLGIVLLVVCSIPRDVGPGWTDAAIVLIVFPAVVALGAMTELRGRLATIAAAGGHMSYPLYAIHFPVIRLIVTGHATPTWAIAPWTLALVALALFLARSYDASFRRWLTSVREQRVPVVAGGSRHDSPPAA